MTEIFLDEEAEQCRQQARAYLGQPEAPFLLRVAREFDRLADERQAQSPTAVCAQAANAAKPSALLRHGRLAAAPGGNRGQ
jgi:hypothetical protein